MKLTENKMFHFYMMKLTMAVKEYSMFILYD